MTTAEAVHADVRPRVTVCPFCGSGCSLLVAGGASHPRLHHPVSAGALCVRGWSVGELLTSPRRVTGAYRRDRGGPLVRTDTAAALSEVVARLRDIVNRRGGASVGLLASARITVEEAGLLRRLAAALGTPHLDTFQRAGYLHLPPVSFDALERARHITVLGANLTVRQPQAGRRLLRAVDRGARVRLVHSRRAQLASLAAEHHVALPGHELEAVPALEPDELVLLSSELALSGQAAAAVGRFGARPVMFLTDYSNQRGVIETGLRPSADGFSGWEMLQAAADGRLAGLLVFGDDPFEFFPGLAGRAFARSELAVVVDAVKSATSAAADFVLPGALLAEKSGTVVNTEGRSQSVTPVARPAGGWTEGAIAEHLVRAFDPDAAPPPAAPWSVGPAGPAADRPSDEYPFLAALDTTLFWNSHALVNATITAWREARNIHADFPPGCVTLNPDDARTLGLSYASAVRVTSADGSVTLPVRHHARMLPGTVWIAMRCWESCGGRIGALEYDPALRIPIFRPRAVRLERPGTRPAPGSQP